MTTMATIAADNAVKSGSDGGHRVFRFAQDPDLNHVTGFPVVGRMSKARGDYYAHGVFMKNESVQREPPTINSATQSARAEITRNAPIKSARAVRKDLRGFMRF